MKFITKLKHARKIIETKGTPDCVLSQHCHHCALMEVGVGDREYVLAGYAGRDSFWSENKSKRQVLALFDNSIKALEAK